MDLLEINKRGMEDEEEWIGDDNDGEIRASHQTDNMDHRGDGNKVSSIRLLGPTPHTTLLFLSNLRLICCFG